MSADQVADLRERLARIEERQTIIMVMLERNSAVGQWPRQDQQQGWTH
jgi:hypothetical protein